MGLFDNRTSELPMDDPPVFKAIYHIKLILYHYVPIIYLIYLIKPPLLLVKSMFDD